MHLDRVTCRRARIARDARFDGRFFIGVRTTGVFCRPVCPAVSPAERNVVYFPTAAAAVEAGYRACLRCRPECAPGTPAWSGVSTTVVRALRLIGDGALEGDNVDELASRLGVGARHLRRLFVEHLGASPIAVAQTRRLLSAKKLMDETDMSLTAIAMSAGFGSIRRFNAAFLSSYGRSPRALREGGAQRRASRARGAAFRGPAVPRARYSFQLRYRPPFDWEALLAFLGPRAIPGVEVVANGTYRRSFEVGGEAGWFEVANGARNALRLDIDVAQAAQLLPIVSRVRRLFDLDADPMAIDTQLAADPLLAPLVARRPGLRVPGAWDGFELAVRAILGQQVSVAAATTLAGRLVARFGRPLEADAGGAERAGAPGRTEKTEGGERQAGRVTHLFPSPEALARGRIADIGLPRRRADAVRAFAEAVAGGDLSFDGALDPVVFRARARGVPGIGDWTAEYIALRALGDPDAFPAGDLGLLHATGLVSARRLAERARAWQPWRAYAALHLWTDGHSRRTD